MSPSDLIAQLIMIDLPGPELSSACRQHLQSYPWGGVLLFARNFVERAQWLDLAGELRTLGDPLLAVDQEGGLVDRIRFPDFVLSPGAMALGAVGDREATRLAHRIVGQQLSELGIHVNFAPCGDINSNPNNPIIGVRSFGQDPVQVAGQAAAACQGLRQGGVAATVKHFPGHGDTSMDSHLGLASLSLTLEQMQERELLPFRACIAAGVEAVMTAHICFSALDSKPATLSPACLSQLLRQQLGFTGVIFTDSMEMGAIAHHYGVGEAAVMALEAGADMIVCAGFEAQREVHQALLRGLEQGRLTLERLQASHLRLARLKGGCQPQLLATNPRFQEQQGLMSEIVERSPTVVRDRGLLPLGPGAVLLLTPDLLPLSPLGEMRQSQSLLQHLCIPDREVHLAHYPLEVRGPALDALLQQAREVDRVILAVYARHRLPDGTRELAQRLLEANPNTVLLSLSSPYVASDLPDFPTVVCAYNYTPLSLRAVGRVLAGELPAQGHLPVTLP